MKCPKCNYEWKPRVKQPKECPMCKGRLSNEESNTNWYEKRKNPNLIIVRPVKYDRIRGYDSFVLDGFALKVDDAINEVKSQFPESMVLTTSNLYTFMSHSNYEIPISSNDFVTVNQLLILNSNIDIYSKELLELSEINKKLEHLEQFFNWEDPNDWTPEDYVEYKLTFIQNSKPTLFTKREIVERNQNGKYLRRKTEYIEPE